MKALNKKFPYFHYYEEKFLDELIGKIKNSYFFIKKIILYGSKARGDFTEDSDIDLLFVTEKSIDKREKYEFFDFLSELEFKYNVLASALFINEREFKEKEKALLFKNIKKEGIILWSKE